MCRVFDTKELGCQRCSRVIENANRLLNVWPDRDKRQQALFVLSQMSHMLKMDAQKIGVRSSNEQLRVVVCAMCIVNLLCKLPSHVESSSYW